MQHTSPSPPAGLPATIDRLPEPPIPSVPLPPVPVPPVLLPTIATGIAAVLHSAKHRVDGWTPVKVAAFIAHLGDTGSVTQAAAYVRMTTASCYALRNRPGGEPFAEAWETAVSTRHEQLADLALDRVRHGVERTRWYRGQAVGRDRVFSDRLLIHLLSATDPARRRRSAVAEQAAAAPPDDAPPDDALPDAVTVETQVADGPTDQASAPGIADTAPTVVVDADLMHSCSADCSAECSAECPAECGTTCPPDCRGNCLAYAALAAEQADDDWLPPDVVAAMAQQAAARAARQAVKVAEMAALDALVDAACGRSPPRAGAEET